MSNSKVKVVLTDEQKEKVFTVWNEVDDVQKSFNLNNYLEKDRFLCFFKCEFFNINLAAKDYKKYKDWLYVHKAITNDTFWLSKTPEGKYLDNLVKLLLLSNELYLTAQDSSILNYVLNGE